MWNDLRKGQQRYLDKSSEEVNIGLRWDWDPRAYTGAYDFELDTSVFLLGKNGKVVSESDFISYDNPSARNDAVYFLNCDELDDDEWITIDFTKLPFEIDKIVIAVSIREAEERGQNFGQVSSVSGHLWRSGHYDDIQFDLKTGFAPETASVVCELCRCGNGKRWQFKAVAEGCQGGLDALRERYGVGIKKVKLTKETMENTVDARKDSELQTKQILKDIFWEPLKFFIGSFFVFELVAFFVSGLAALFTSKLLDGSVAICCGVLFSTLFIPVVLAGMWSEFKEKCNQKDSLNTGAVLLIKAAFIIVFIIAICCLLCILYFGNRYIVAMSPSVL